MQPELTVTATGVVALKPCAAASSLSATTPPSRMRMEVTFMDCGNPSSGVRNGSGRAAVSCRPGLPDSNTIGGAVDAVTGSTALKLAAARAIASCVTFSGATPQATTTVPDPLQIVPDGVPA